MFFALSFSFFLTFGTDDEFGEKTVSVLLDGEESEIVFIDHPSSEMSVSFLYLSFNRCYQFFVVFVPMGCDVSCHSRDILELSVY